MKKVLKYGVLICLMLFILVFSLNFYVKFSTKKQIVEDTYQFENIDCILILGAGVWEDGPSPILQDRLDVGIELYKKGVAPKIIMSGDHGRKEYDEVNAMKDYAIKKGVPSEDIFMDHAGFSTYESIYRVKEIFKAKRVIIVTQEYHLYRSIYIANKLKINAFGVRATPNSYAGGLYRELREIIARDKDVIKCIIKPKPTYLGEEIPVSGNGDITND